MEDDLSLESSTNGFDRDSDSERQDASKKLEQRIHPDVHSDSHTSKVFDGPRHEKSNQWSNRVVEQGRIEESWVSVE